MKIDRHTYASHYGPTTGDRVRLGDTGLIIEVESDRTVYGDESKFGGGKVIRDGMGQSPEATRAGGAPDLVITNALVVDYSGIYNVTDSQGNILARRYTGEPRFVAVLLNVTSPYSTDQEAILVPRSLFFSTLLYTYLNSTSPPSLVGQLSYAQNSTTAAANADDLQEILYGNVSLNDFLTIVGDLEVNASGGTIGRSFVFSINDEVAGNPLFYSLPDRVVRLVGYLPPLTASSWSYTFCTSSCGQPTQPPWWEAVWNGYVSVVTAVVQAAVVLAVTAFKAIGAILAQIGAWLVAAGNAVKSTVQAAAKVWGEVVDWIRDHVVSLIESAVSTAARLARILWQASIGGLISDVTTAATTSGQDQNGAILSAANRLLSILTVFMLVDVAIRAAEIAAAAASMGIAYVVSKIVSDSVVKYIVMAIASTVLLIGVEAVFTQVAESVGWVDKTTGAFADSVDKGADAVENSREVVFGMAALLLSKLAGDNSFFKQWKVFALVLVGLITAVASFFVPKGVGVAVLDFLSLMWTIFGVMLYVPNSTNLANKASDLASTYAVALERVVVYASPPVALVNLGADYATGGFNGS